MQKFLLLQITQIKKNSSIDRHQWLIGPQVDVVPRLLLPLAGPDTFTLEENESLPVDLQFLPDDKTREQDAAIRLLLLEALMQVSYWCILGCLY